MAYTDFFFPPSTPLFPPASTVLTYLNSYADHFHLRPYIHFNTTVTNIDYQSPKWIVQTSPPSPSSPAKFDLVIICNGHYKVPRYPDIPGLGAWLNARKATHSAWYRNPSPTLGDTILVVGGGPSGQDISNELRLSGRTVFQSVSSPEGLGPHARGRLSQLNDPSKGEVTFSDGSTLSNIDYCIFATGYKFSSPFFPSHVLQPSVSNAIPPLPTTLHNSTYNIFPLAKHIFPLQTAFPPISLAFLGLLIRVAPFPLVEAQAKAVLAAFSNPEKLDQIGEAVDVMNRYQELRTRLWESKSTPGEEEIQIAKLWHRFEPLEQFEYRDQMCAFAGDETRVESWEVEMYLKKNLLRKVWNALVKTGEVGQCVRGVGHGGKYEWVELMRWMVKKGEEEDLEEKARL